MEGYGYQASAACVACRVRSARPMLLWLLLLWLLLLLLPPASGVETLLTPVRFGDTDDIPLEYQQAEFVRLGEIKTLYLHKNMTGGPLSITVTPCTSSINWTVSYRPRDKNPAKFGTGGQASPPPPAPVSPLPVGASPSAVTSKPSPNAAPPTLPEKTLDSFRGHEQKTLALEHAEAGVYVLRLRVLEREAYVHVYATVRSGGPHALMRAPRSKLRTQRRRGRGADTRLTVRWEPSAVDPHVTRYCLVVNPRRRYSTLCEAKGERNGVVPPPALWGEGAARGFSSADEDANRRKLQLANKAAIAASPSGGGAPVAGDKTLESAAGLRLAVSTATPTYQDLVVVCVGKRLQYTLSGLQPGRVYHIDLFAVNRKSKLSYSYGSTSLKLEPRTRPLGLRDGQPTMISLKKLDGRAVFRLKVGKSPGRALLFYVMPCGGGAVDVRVKLQEKAVMGRTRVQGYGTFSVAAPRPGQRYLVIVSAPNAEELRHVAAVEVFATTSEERFPFPTLPFPPRLHEYDSLRRCDSVTVGWLPAVPGAALIAANASADAPTTTPTPTPAATPLTQPLRYCVVAREVQPEDRAAWRVDQCGLGSSAAPRRGKKSVFAVRMCSDMGLPEAAGIAASSPAQSARTPLARDAVSALSTSNASRREVSTFTVGHLLPGRPYTVQVTVEQVPGGRPLSYELLPVHTKPRCT